jgi:hypothetical protein
MPVEIVDSILAANTLGDNSIRCRSVTTVVFELLIDFSYTKTRLPLNSHKLLIARCLAWVQL